MVRRFFLIFGIALVTALPSSALAAAGTSVAESSTPSIVWEPAMNDIFVVDVPQNIGYLVHSDGQLFSFPVATGRKAYVHYIGRSYKADTPIRTWTAEQRQIKGDHRTFGVNGRFLRLFRDGESSPYGIHSYYKVGEWMEEEQRYFSMGCIVVTEDVLDVIEATYTLNNKKLTVITTENTDETLTKIAAASEAERAAKNSLAVDQ